MTAENRETFPEARTREERLKSFGSFGHGDTMTNRQCPKQRTVSLSYPAGNVNTSTHITSSSRQPRTPSTRIPLLGSKSVTFSPKDFYSWFPPDATPSQVDQYFKQLPTCKIPRIRSLGQKYRDFQLQNQIPIQDLSSDNCLFLEPWFTYRFDAFVQDRSMKHMSVGSVVPTAESHIASKCLKCEKPPDNEYQVVVTSDRLPDPKTFFHPSCFVCCVCHELLVDLIHCVSTDGQLYCERHFAETIRPRCHACDELIFSDEGSRSIDKDFHMNHFSCWQCDESLVSQRYVQKDEHPYCTKCYESKFCHQCEECQQIIGIEYKDLSYRDKHWHEKCFNCSKCSGSLVDKSFGSKTDKLYCVDCYDDLFALRCEGCNKPFKSGTSKMEYKGHQWHDTCFVCAGCKVPIMTNTFVPRENENYCTKCYEDKFANRCSKCAGVISAGGVTYQNAHWHTECFTCANCDVQLVGQKFTRSKENKTICCECVNILYGKKCTACSNLITGISGTKYISFEERSWHNECFNCVDCKASLVGKGFMPDGLDIICSDCAKARLSTP